MKLFYNNRLVCFFCLAFVFLVLSSDVNCQIKEDLSESIHQLEKAQQLLDSSKVNEALILAKEVEAKLLEHYKPEDGIMGDVYCMIGICLLKTQSELSEEYFQKIKNLESPSTILTQAHMFYFFGVHSSVNGKYEEALQSYQESLKLYQKEDHFHVNAAQAYTNSGVLLARKSKYKEALENYQKALEILKQNYGDMYPVAAHPYNNQGLVFVQQGFYNKAVTSYEKALKIRMNTLGPNHPEVAATLVNIGLIETFRGEFDRANVYFLKSLDIAIKTEKTNYLPAIYTNIGLVYNNKEMYPNAREYFEKSLEVELRLYPFDDPEIATSLFNIAVTYKDQKKSEKALEYYFKSLEIAKNDHPHIGMMYNGVGLVYHQQKKFNEAKEYFNKALEQQSNLFNENHPTVANIYYNLAKLEKEVGSMKEALYLNEQARNSLGYIYGKELRSVISPFDLLKVLHQEVYFNWFVANQEGDEQKMVLAGESCQRAIKVIGFLRNSYKGKTDKQALIAFGYDVFETAVNVSLSLYKSTNKAIYAADAFTFVESSKSILLHEAFQEASARRMVNIPESLLQREHDFRVDIAFNEKKYQEQILQSESNTTPEMLSISSKLFDLDQEYSALKRKIKTEYPEYYKAKYDLSAISLGEVQNELLQADQSLLEYMVGDSSIFLFLVQKDTFEVHEIKHDFPLKDLVQEMTKDGIYGYYTASTSERTRKLEEETIVNYTNAAQQLYEKLIAPVAEKLTENLIIIPDGVLGYVPFEALLTEAPPRMGAFKAYPFLLNKHQISYCYSATLLREMQQKQHRQDPSEQLLAMAPFFQGDVREFVPDFDTTDLVAISLRDSLGALPASGEEVAAINDLWNGTSIFGSEASLAEFQQKASDYRVLHLSTHGKADDRVGDYAYLAFGVPDKKGTFDKLFARDLYNYSLNADMVVLSACETGIGKLQKGEGIISLSRAFAYAGAKSIFTTLWQVSDEKTKDIFISFYNYLKKGKSKDEALRLAKLDYLKANAGKGQGTHPFFWAGLIGIGDMSAVNTMD